MNNRPRIDPDFTAPASYRYDEKLSAQSAMLEELLKATEIQQLFESYYNLFGIPVAIIDRRANVLLSSRWQRIFTQFHRAHPTTCGLCLESDTKLATHLQEGKNYAIYTCQNGLTDCASPIIIEGNHIANVFMGQFLTEDPDEAWFRLQAKQRGFDVADYLSALREVPIIAAERIPDILNTLASVARVITTLGTERKRAVDSQARLSVILNAIPQSVFWKDIHSRYLGCNAPFARAAGLATPDEIIGKTDFDLPWPREAAESYRADDLAVISANQPKLHSVESVQQADGSRVVIDTSKIPLLDASNTLHGVVCIYEDITEGKRAEARLKKSEEKFRKAFMTRADALYIAKVDNGSLIEVNDRFEEVFGYSRKEAIGKTSIQLDLYADPVEWGRIISEVKSHGYVRNMELGARRKGGEIFPSLISVNLLHEGGEQCILGVIRDITERKRLETELRGNAALLARILEATSGGVWDWNIPNGNAVFSPRYAAMLGYDPEDFPKDYYSWSRLVHPDDVDRVKQAHADHIVGHKDFSVEFRMREKSGDWHWIHSRGLLIERDAEGKPVRMVGTHTDIQERKLAQLKLEQQVVFDGLITKILARFATCTAPDIDAGIVAALQAIAEFIEIDHAVIIAISEDRTTWSITHEWCAPHVVPAIHRYQRIPMGTLPFTEHQILMGEVVRLNTSDDLPQDAIEERRHQVAEGYLSRLGVPIRTKSGMQGSIGLLSHARQVAWSDEEVSRLRMVVGAIAGVLERKLVANNQLKLLQRNYAYLALVATQQYLANEVARAAEYVMSLLPAPISVGDVKTVWRYVPSATLGGDSFGYHWVDENHFAFYLLDVCGHGVGSALLSVSALNVLRAQSLPNVDFRDPVAVLGGMNASFQMTRQNGLYFTLWYGVYNRQTRRLRHASAGHPPGLLVGDSLPVTQLNSTNFFIGAFPKVDYEAAEIDIPANSRLYLFSDGVYEVDRPDGTMWSFEELQDLLSRPAEESGAEIEALYKTLQEMHSGDVLDDDFSLLRVDFHSQELSKIP